MMTDAEYALLETAGTKTCSNWRARYGQPQKGKWADTKFYGVITWGIFIFTVNLGDAILVLACPDFVEQYSNAYIPAGFYCVPKHMSYCFNVSFRIRNNTIKMHNFL